MGVIGFIVHGRVHVSATQLVLFLKNHVLVTINTNEDGSTINALLQNMI